MNNSRPEFPRGTILTAAIISRIRQEQEYWDKTHPKEEQELNDE